MIEGRNVVRDPIPFQVRGVCRAIRQLEGAQEPERVTSARIVERSDRSIRTACDGLQDDLQSRHPCDAQVVPRDSSPSGESTSVWQRLHWKLRDHISANSRNRR